VADNALASAASLLYDMRGPLQANYPKDHVLLAEWSGVGAEDPSIGRVTPRSSGQIEQDNREIFSGKQVRVPVDLNMLQAGGFVGEGSTASGNINAPIAAAFTEAHINLVDVVQPVSITLDLSEDSLDNSAADALARLTIKAREALAEIVNDAMNGNGDAQLAVADSTQASAGGLTLKVTAATDFDKLYVGKVVDVLTAADGTDPGQGKRRKIASFSETASPPTITFDTNAQASDGGSGNITLSNAVAVYIAGSYGNSMQGIEQAAATSGTFEAISRTTYPQWKGTDGRNGTTTTAPLSDQMLDAGVLLGLRYGNPNGQWDFGIGDPNSINVHKNGKLSVVRYTADTMKVPSGFSGIVYDGTGQPIPLIPERKHKVGSVKLLRRDIGTLYGRRKGPDFDQMTGSRFMRFQRSLPFEFWLVDRLNWGFHNPAGIVSFSNLATS
jgi:hypothetical protein